MTKEQLGSLIIASEDSMYRIAKSLLHNETDCADAIQEAIVLAFSKLHTLKNDKYAKTWLVRILMNECYSIMRREKKLVSLDEIPEKSAYEKKDYSDLYMAVSRLPQDMRMAVVLYYAEGLSVKEIAAIEDTTESAVKNRLFKARAKLKVLLEGRGGNNDMKLEHLKDEYPATPENIRMMIEKEVREQMRKSDSFEAENIEQTDDIAVKAGDIVVSDKTISIRSWKKAAIVALAATMALGTTVFAGTKAYQWYMQKEGDYGLKAAVAASQPADSSQPAESSQTADSSQEGDSAEQAAAPEEIPIVSIKAKYLPDRMVAADDGETKFYYSDTPYQGGISLSVIAMDEKISAEKLPLSDTYVTESEALNIAGHEAVYVKKDIQPGQETGFDKKLYIAYPEYWQILEIFVGEDVSKEEALKIAENIDLQNTGETEPLSEACTWSKMVTPEKDEDTNAKLTASKEEMKNTHKIGEAFSISTSAVNASSGACELAALQAKVTDVQITDDNGLLDKASLDNDVSKAFDENGKLLPNDITYMQSGNGIDSLDKKGSTATVNQKLVYVSVEYTNTGTEELNEVLFSGAFAGMTEGQDGYTFYDRAQCDEDENTDYVTTSSIGSFGEMDYFDIHSGERSNNYIPSIKPGETITVHLAKIVNEDELDKMYLSLASDGGSYEFSEKALQEGYVDLRQ